MSHMTKITKVSSHAEQRDAAWRKAGAALAADALTTLADDGGDSPKDDAPKGKLDQKPEGGKPSDKELEMQRRIVASGYNRKVMRAELAKLSDKELFDFQLKTKALMLQTLHPNPRMPTDRAAMRRIYRATRMLPDFLAKEKKVLETTLRAIMNDRDIATIRKNWRNASGQQKRHALQKMLTVHSRAAGLKPPQLNFFSEAPRGGGIVKGYYKPGTNEIYLNTHRAANFSDFALVVNTLIHENSHWHQYQMVEKLKKKQIGRKDAFYVQAVVFALNFANHGYVDFRESAKDYQQQPVEQHSFSAGNSVESALKRFGFDLKMKDPKPDPNLNEGDHKAPIDPKAGGDLPDKIIDADEPKTPPKADRKRVLAKLPRP
ncbi:MAG: hypothetical protein Alpg2KO_21370 [Alphaproteobacteria bacterium]